MILPGLARDTFTVSRPGNQVDSEGNAWGTFTVLGSFTGTWGSPSARDVAVANRRGEQIDSVIATASYTDAQPDDQVSGLHNKTWTVVAVEPLPVATHVRVMLREVN